MLSCGSRYRHSLKFENFASSFGRLHQDIASATRLFLLIQPIIVLICGVVVTVAVGVS